MRSLALVLLLTSTLPAANPVPEGAKVAKLADGFAFTEGPSADAAGNVYFTDQPNDRIMLWSVDGKLSEWMKPCGRSNGLCFDKDGLLWACADDKNELWTIDPKTKAKTVVVKDFDGKLLNGPNDLWVTPTGGVYFTDPYYKRPYWKRGPIEQNTQGVYFLPPKGKPVRVADDLKQPNGIVGTPDGKMLYVADIGAKKTYSYAIAEDGSLKDKKLFCEDGSDGMTLDEAGNVYLTGRGVLVYDKSGRKTATIPVPEGWTANVCFGGAAMDTLFITASKGLYSIKLNAKGAARQ
jgi:gluconolactonase